MALVMVVEDDSNFREMLCDMLSRAGHVAMAAASGEECLAICRQGRPDVVITDILMPGGGGVVTIAQLKKEFPGIKIIAISGGGFIAGDTYLKAAKAITKVQVALTKPFSKDELLDAVNALLREH